MEREYLPILLHEFSAGEESFLLQLRINLYWDKAAFDRLTEAMRACCQAYEREGQTEEQYLEATLPRWLASGFWYLATFVKGHTSHPAWEQRIAQEPEYFRQAYELLEELAEWFFEGQAL